MRAQTVIVFLSLVLLAGLAALNLDELMRPTGLNLGWQTLAEASLAAVLVGVAVSALLLTLLAGAVDQRKLEDALKLSQEDLAAQRALADKAEGSRLLEVQRHLDLQAQASEHREREMLANLNERLDQVQRALQQQMDQVGNSLAAYIGEVEDRLERMQVLHPSVENYREDPYARR